MDIYLFIILVHASITWMPRPMASQEFIKYAPLEVSAVTNDLDLWVSLTVCLFIVSFASILDLSIAL